MRRKRTSKTQISLFSFQDIITATTGILILLALVLALSVISQRAAENAQSESVDATELLEQQRELEQAVAKMRAQSDSLSAEIQSWSNSTPSELRDKIRSTTQQNADLQTAIAKAKRAKQDLQKQLSLLESSSAAKLATTELKRKEAEVENLKKSLSNLAGSDRVAYNFRENTKRAWLLVVDGNSISAAPTFRAEAPKRFSAVSNLEDFIQKIPVDQQYFVILLKPSGIDRYDAIKQIFTSNQIDVGTELLGESLEPFDNRKGAVF